MRHLRLSIVDTTKKVKDPITGVLQYAEALDNVYVACGWRLDQGLSVVRYLPAVTCKDCLVTIDALMELNLATVYEQPGVINAAVWVPAWIFPHPDPPNTYSTNAFYEWIDTMGNTHRSAPQEQAVFVNHRDYNNLSAMLKEAYSKPIGSEIYRIR